MVVILIKRRRRWKHLKRVGRLDLLHEAPRKETFIVPPDPAILEGAIEDLKKSAKSKGKRPVKTSEVAQNVDLGDARYMSGTKYENTYELQESLHKDFAVTTRDEFTAGTSRVV